MEIYNETEYDTADLLALYLAVDAECWKARQATKAEAKRRFEAGRYRYYNPDASCYHRQPLPESLRIGHYKPGLRARKRNKLTNASMIQTPNPRVGIVPFKVVIEDVNPFTLLAECADDSPTVPHSLVCEIVKAFARSRRMGYLENGVPESLADAYPIRLAELGGQASKERMARERKRAQIASLQQQQAHLEAHRDHLAKLQANTQAKIDAIKAKVNELEPGMVLYV